MKKIIFISAWLLFLLSCSNDDNDLNIEDNSNEPVNSEFPDDITKLFVGKGDINAATVVIYEQGGPDTELDVNYFESGGSFNSDFTTLLKDYYRVYAHQTLTLNPGLCDKGKITKSQATAENEISVEILDRLIKHFKSQGKTVFVIGHSFGGFVLTKYIAEKGNSTADKFLIMASRLEMQPEVATNFSECKPYYFKNGTTPAPEDRPDVLEEYNEIRQSYPSVFSLLGAMGSERFIPAIEANDLSNVIYVFAKDDEQTGGLLVSEKEFLNSKNVDVIEISTGGHGAMFDGVYPKTIVDLLNKK